MKQSIWLQNYENEIKEKRNKKNKNNKIVIPITMLVMLGLGTVSAISNGALDTAEGRMGMGMFAGIIIFIMLFSFLMSSIGKKKDVTAYTRNEVNALFQSDDDVDRFDQEMSCAPIKEIKINTTTTMFMTESYIGSKTTTGGTLNYSFIKKQDMASFHKKKTGSTTANPINAAFFFDIRNSQQKVIMNGLADSGKQLDAITEMLAEANPNIQFN